MSLSLRLNRLYAGRPHYLKLAEETCLTRRRAAGLYMHAAVRPAYLLCLVASLAASGLMLAYAYRPSAVPPSPPPSQRAQQLTTESRTPRGYPRRYVSHLVKAGDTYYLLAQRYYGGLMDIFVRNHGCGLAAWEVIKCENPQGDFPPFEPEEIPVTIELRIPLP
jgi:hypothetical protein